jgi:hypothetical protein
MFVGKEENEVIGKKFVRHFVVTIQSKVGDIEQYRKMNF